MDRPASKSKRFYTCKRLQKLLPRLNLTAVIVRVTQFFVIGGFTIAYAMASPEVYLDIFVWPMNQTTPFEITIYRNSSGEWPNRAERFEYQWLAEPWPIVKLRWNETKPPPGLSEVYVCQTDPRWNCTGEQWAAARIGWWDSWPFDHFTPPWAAGMVYIDRYIFWLFMLGGYLGIGQCVVALVHALDPSGIGFYKYCVGMDFVISIVFLLLGIFPIAIQKHIEGINEEATFISFSFAPPSPYVSSLMLHQQHAFVMGWILWSLFSVTALLNLTLVLQLQKYKKLSALEESAAGETIQASATSSAFRAELHGDPLDPSMLGSHRRYVGQSGR